MRREGVHAGLLEDSVVLSTTIHFQSALPTSLQNDLVQAYTPEQMAVFFRGEGEWVDQYELARRLVNDFGSWKGVSQVFDSNIENIRKVANEFCVNYVPLDLAIATRLLELERDTGVLRYLVPANQPSQTSAPRIYLS